MKHIKIFDEIIATGDKEKFKTVNYTLYWAYVTSLDNETETIDFDGAIWDKDIKPIVDTCRENGFEEITISSTMSNIIETIYKFIELGCEINGFREIETNFTDFRTGEKDIKHAMVIKL